MSNEENTIMVNEEDLLSIALLKCDKVRTTGDKNTDCSKRNLPIEQYCGSCFARNIACKYLSTTGSEK